MTKQVEANGDVTFLNDCGCAVTFFTRSGMRSSRMLACDRHKERGQIDARNRIVDMARDCRDGKAKYETVEIK